MAASSWAWPEFVNAMDMSGAGTLLNPYTIHNIYDLQAMMFDRHAHYKLSSDIDASPALAFYAGQGFLAVPASDSGVGFPHMANEDVDVTGAWTSNPAVLPDYLHLNINDFHLDDEGPIENWFDWGENDGDVSYVELVNQTNKWIGVNNTARHLPLNFGGDNSSMVAIVCKQQAGTQVRLRPAIKVGGTWYSSGSYINAPASYGAIHWSFWQNPATSANWTRDQLMGIGANALEAWGADVEGSNSGTVRITAIKWLPQCSVDINAGYDTDDWFDGSLDGNDKTISDLPLNQSDSYCGGMFYKFAGEAYDLIMEHPYIDGLLNYGETGAFARMHWGYAHNIEIRDAELYLIRGGAFALELVDCGYTADGVLCEDVRVVNPTIYIGNNPDSVSGFANVLYSNTAFTATVQKSYVKNMTLTREVGGAPVDVAGFISWVYPLALIDECWCSGSIHVDIGAYGFAIDIGDTSLVRNCYARMELTEDTGDLLQAVTLGGFCRAILATGEAEKCYDACPVMSSPNNLRAAFILDVNVLGTLTDAHVDAQATPHDLAEGAVENTIAEMKDVATYVNWNFAGVWTRLAAKNDGYPYLDDAPPSGPPEVYSCLPVSGAQGWTGDVVIAGYNFTNATSVSFHVGVTVNLVTVDNDTQITANITIAGGAGLGLRDVDVTTPYGTGTKIDGFTVTAGGYAGILGKPTHPSMACGGDSGMVVPAAAADLLFGTGVPYSLFYVPPPIPPTPPAPPPPKPPEPPPPPPPKPPEPPPPPPPKPPGVKQGTLSVGVTGVVNANAPIIVDGTLRGYNKVVMVMDPGNHTVHFGDVAGFLTPKDQTALVVADQTTNIVAIYLAIAPPPVAPPPPPVAPPPTSQLTVKGWLNEWVVTDYKNPSLYGYWRKRWVRFLSYTITKDGAVIKTTAVGSSNGDTWDLAQGTYRVEAWNYTGFTPPAPVTITLPGTVELVWQGTKP